MTRDERAHHLGARAVQLRQIALRHDGGAAPQVIDPLLKSADPEPQQPLGVLLNRLVCQRFLQQRVLLCVLLKPLTRSCGMQDRDDP